VLCSLGFCGIALLHVCCFADEAAAKKAAAAAVSQVLEGDLLSKPLASFTSVVWRYALPWEEFLAKAFESTFGVASASSSSSMAGASSSWGTSGLTRTFGAEAALRHARGHLTMPFPTGGEQLPPSLGAPLSLQHIEGSSSSCGSAEMAVLSAPFLRSPPGLVRTAAAEFASSTRMQHQQAQRVFARTSAAATITGGAGFDQSLDNAGSDIGNNVQGDATRELIDRVHSEVVRRASEVSCPVYCSLYLRLDLYRSRFRRFCAARQRSGGACICP
jgi:hypothetical protein